ncbi:MAG: hypothetical protein JXB88_26575 [Spirochaetales bacterium]|nr:hypothetical protein [Spirochaetales bacterium]
MKKVFYLLFIMSIIIFSMNCGHKTNTRDNKNENTADAEKTVILDDTETDRGEKQTSSSTADISMTDDTTISETHKQKDDSASPAIKLNKSTFSPDEEMPVSYSASPDIADNAWIGIIPSLVPHGNNQKNDNNDIDFDFLAGHTSGTIMFLAPHFKGEYDLRMSDPDSGKEVASVSFTVK